MSKSVRALFQRQDFLASAGNSGTELISLRHSLKKHDGGLAMGLREALKRFSIAADGNGFARGCKSPSQTVAPDLAYVVPSWVPAHDFETRTLEGVLTKSNVTYTDFPFKPWHTYYDWNYHIRVDPQYQYLISKNRGANIECEWDTAYLPSWAWPQDGNRIWMRGRWIYDCGHPDNGTHKTEIHPPKAVVSFRREAVQFAENTGPTRANNAVLFIGTQGGYWNQPINDEDYEFDFPLPPRPHPSAVPVFKVVSKTGDLPVQPQFTPVPASHPQFLRVTIPLKGITPAPTQYGAILSCGWSDPAKAESNSIHRIRVRVQKIHMSYNYDDSPDEWHVYVGVNGRWKVWKDLSGSQYDLNFTVDLDLHPSDEIRVTACGFEADLIHDYIGVSSGYTWPYITGPLTQAEREAVEDSLFWQAAGSFDDRNEPLGYLTKFHPADVRQKFHIASDIEDYQLEYTIEDR